MAQPESKIRIDKVRENSGYIYLIKGDERRVVIWTAERVYPPRNSPVPVTRIDLLAARRELERCGLLPGLADLENAPGGQFLPALDVMSQVDLGHVTPR